MLNTGHCTTVWVGNIHDLILSTSIRGFVPHTLYYPHAPIPLPSNAFTVPATEGWGWIKNVPAQLEVLRCHCNVGIKSRNICRGSCSQL